METQEPLNRVKELIRPVLSGHQAELVEMAFRYEGSRFVLRLLVDTARGITLDQLSALNQAIGAVLDEHDAIPDRYTLEVSSPGLDRRLKAPLDFERVIGRRVRVHTTSAVLSRWEWVGELLGANEEAIVLKTDDGQKVRILLSQVAKAVQEIKL